MHNGCLLLLAFVAVFQPIASYTERGLVDGRQQRCDYRTSVRDPGLKFHGTYRFTKPAVEDRRLNHREDIRDVRRNEVREESLRTASSSDRRLADALGRDRNTLRGPSRDRIGNDAVLRREFREARLISYRDERNQENRHERVARVQETHQARSASHREHSRAEYDNRYQRHRDSIASRRDIRSNGNNAEAQRTGENRDIRAATNRVRDVARRLNDRRLTREGVQRMDMQRSASRIQLDGNTDREILGRRSRDMELRSSPTTREETTSLGRDNRRISSSRRSFDERRLMRDVSQIRLAFERRNMLESTSRMNIRDLQDRVSEHRREARSTESRREIRDTESKAGIIIRTVRSVDAPVFEDDDSGSRLLDREQSLENRRHVRDSRSMERFRTSERSAEYRKDSRYSDHARVLKNLREIRNIETRRDNRKIERDASEVRDQTRNNNRDTCVYDRECSTEQRITRLARERSQENRRSARNAESRAMSTDRVGESRRVTRNNDLRLFNTERAEQNRRDTHNYAESRVTERIDEIPRDNRNFRTERTVQMRKDARKVDTRLFRTERSDKTRRADRTVRVQFRTERKDNSRQNGFRAFETERTSDSRRNTQDFERQSRSLERDIDYRRDSRNNVRIVRLYEPLENRRNIRNIESRTEDERVANYRRASRSTERMSRTIERERTIESRLNERITRDSRTVLLERRPEERRERAIENRREVKNTPKELRARDTQERRRIQSRGINLVRSRDDFAQRKTDRAIERLNKRDSLENMNRYTLQRESERDSMAARLREAEARDGFNADSRKREFQTMFKNPTHAENEAPTRNWQYIFYTVQALYIGGLLMQLNKRSVDKKTRVSWWSAASAPQHLIKVE